MAERPTERPMERAPLVPPATFALVATLVGVHFLRWTVLRPEVLVEALAFHRGDLDAGRWWSAATYSLVQPSATLLALAVYVLLVFGPRLERIWGPRRFVGFAAFAALGGWMVHLFVGGTAPLLGATSVALGVLAAHALRWGAEERILAGGFTVRVRWAAAFVAAVLLLTALQEPIGGGGAALAHLGGLGAAWLFTRATHVLLVERIRDGVSAQPDEPPEDQPPRAIPKSSPRARGQRETIDDVVARSNAAAARRRADPERPALPRAAGEPAVPPTVDAILDKILTHGLDGLTDEERRILDDHSRRLRDS
ncbi:rhomboid family intramembrane serine protease [Pseudogemmatithrix spongiicola]|uniref:Rhomboid family intramembrane serine protease n=1 Tax=Pseudogemmatithrix spongiicola TaxID=3062599 RepID=A0AA49JXI3_9BACT|nr:rhomboid family intramembrane serine protease [Gemmatimonadaceae bacterium 'strain 138']WKW16528.1 rhomboid family intramembrane serine protease [Gemmatimonadaceae bacterium 'strain 318']